MLLQTNSYVVPKEKRVEHARLLRRFRQALQRLGCDHFEVYEQVGANWNAGDVTGRYVQIMRFRDRKHQLEVQAAERGNPTTQALLREFCDLINFPYQQQQGLFAVGYYTSFLRMPPARTATEYGAMEAADHAPREAEQTPQAHSEQSGGILSMDSSPDESTQPSDGEANSEHGSTTDQAEPPVEDSQVEQPDSQVEQLDSQESAIDDLGSNSPDSDAPNADSPDSDSHVDRRFILESDEIDSPIPFSQGNEIGVDDSEEADSAAVAEDANGEDDESASHPDR